MWSDDVGLSSRRFLALSCEVFAGLAIARHATARQFVGMVFACTLAWLGLGLVAELSLGAFHPWQAGYRFAGVFHPNLMGVNCALLFMSALYLRGESAAKNRLLLFVAFAALVFLVLTGSRTALAAVVVSSSAGWLAVRSRSLPLYLSFGLIFAAVSFAVGIGLGSLDGTSSWLALGRTDSDLNSLTGRVPLWYDLMSYYVPLRPLTGSGYGAFWSEERILEISHYQTWSVTHAHSTYLDFVLNTGLIGGVLCLSAMLVALVVAARREAQQPRAGYGFIALVIVFTLTGGLLESYIGTSWFLSFFGICGVAYLICTGEPDGGEVHQPVQARRPIARPAQRRVLST